MAAASVARIAPLGKSALSLTHRGRHPLHASPSLTSQRGRVNCAQVMALRRRALMTAIAGMHVLAIPSSRTPNVFRFVLTLPWGSNAPKMPGVALLTENPPAFRSVTRERQASVRGHAALSTQCARIAFRWLTVEPLRAGSPLRLRLALASPVRLENAKRRCIAALLAAFRDVIRIRRAAQSTATSTAPFAHRGRRARQSSKTVMLPISS